MSRRTVTSAVSAGNGAFECAARRISQTSSRSFSSTAQRNATQITHFTPTSSPELDALLSTIREKIILPSYLTLAQRKRLYAAKWAKKLQSDPIIIEIDGEVFRFRHLDASTGDVPSTRKSVVAAVRQFQTAEDFANLRPLLEGLHAAAAGRDGALVPDVHAKIVRLAGARGRIADVLECARGARRTGFRLDASEKVNEVLHFVQLKAVEAGWVKSETEQALRWAELVVDLLDDEAHAPRSIVEGDVPLSRDPQVLMAPLHLAAALIKKCGVQDAKLQEKVNRLASAVVRSWPNSTELKRLHPVKAYVDQAQVGYLLQPNKFVAMASPLLHGLQLAAQVVSDSNVAEELHTRQITLEREIETARREAAQSGKTGRGDAVYNMFYGEERS